MITISCVFDIRIFSFPCGSGFTIWKQEAENEGAVSEKLYHDA